MQGLIAIAMAIGGVSLTTAFNLIIIWWLDRFEKEPIWLLLLVFIWGCVPAVVISLIFEIFLGIPVGIAVGPGHLNMVVGAVLIAPPVEEIAKAVALFIVFLVLRNEFDDILDGIIYGAVVGLGFAFTEDLFYLFNSLSTGGIVGMGFVFFLRIFVFGLNHAFFTSIAGIGLGLARLTKWYFGIPLAILGLLGAITLHGMHNLLVSLPGDMMLGGVVLAWLTHISAAVALIIMVIVIWIIEMKWIRKELLSEIDAGYVTQFEYDNVVKFFGRFLLQAKFLLYLDIAGYFRITRMFNLLVKLAFRKRAYKREEKKSQLQEIVNLRKRISDLRLKFAN